MTPCIRRTVPPAIRFFRQEAPDRVDAVHRASTPFVHQVSAQRYANARRLLRSLDCFAMMTEAATISTPLLESVEVSAVVGSLVTVAMFGAATFGFIFFRVGAKRARWRPTYTGLGIWSAGSLSAGIVTAVRGELLEVGFATIFFLTSAGIWTQVVFHKRRMAALRAAKRTD